MKGQSRRSSWLLLLLVILVLYGWDYYRGLRTGQITPALPVQMHPSKGQYVASRLVALIAGHEGSDVGATCPDGLTEVAVNRQIAHATAAILRDANTDVLILQEYDPRLEGLRADALVAIHADSCVPRQGFKVARWVKSPDPGRDEVLVACLVHAYQTQTGLPLDTRTITEDMTEYHAFRKIAPTTPAAIIEVGYLGGDRRLLTQEPERPALGIAEGLACFFKWREEQPRVGERPSR